MIRRSLLGSLVAAMLILPSTAATIHATATGFSQAEAVVLDCAIGFWERAIRNPITLTVGISMLPLEGDMLGASFDFTQDENGMPTGATVNIDDRADSLFPWFVDPTPDRNEEFRAGETPWHYRGLFPGEAGENYDLLTVLFHELGHVFGFSANYSRFAAHLVPTEDGFLRNYLFSPGHPNEGSPATLTSPGEGTHLSDFFHPFDLMIAFQGRGERMLPSDLDFAILSDAFDYLIESPTPAPIPEPVTFVLAGGGVVLVLLRRCRLFL